MAAFRVFLLLVTFFTFSFVATSCRVTTFTNFTRHKAHNMNDDTTAESKYSFYPGSPKWGYYRLTCIFPKDMSADAKNMLVKAFRTWSDATKFQFPEYGGYGGPPDLYVGFFRGGHGVGEPVDRYGRIIAQAFAPPDGRIQFNADERWSSPENSVVGDFFDLESVALHEIGHALGLDHSLDPSAVMYESMSPREVKRQLSKDDIDGINALYGWS